MVLRGHLNRLLQGRLIERLGLLQNLLIAAGVDQRVDEGVTLTNAALNGPGR